MISSFSEKSVSSFVILSDIEKRIKEKIEKVGIPLKNWDIQINYGIKTGFNEAFIINGEKKAELVAKSSKNAEIIRPILRGRDIKRYGYEFADLWLICTHNGTPTESAINIDDYPDIKAHLDNYYSQLTNRQDKGITPYNLRSCIYMDDFSKQKIIWIELTDHPNFALDLDGYYINNTVFFITGKHLKY
ncbi:type II restriction endonuclease, partial [Dysgonomonas mossii]